jgi:hypothetical protein
MKEPLDVSFLIQQSLFGRAMPAPRWGRLDAETQKAVLPLLAELLRSAVAVSQDPRDGEEAGDE